jgi:hypothetical protein
MQILTLTNEAFSLNNLPDEVDENMKFSVLDNSNPQDPDFYFMPLIYLESFNAPAIVMKIGNNEIMMPIDWCIAVGDSSSATHIEILPLTSLNDRGFDALVFNPVSDFRIEFQKIEIINFYNDIKWYFPKIKVGHLLTTPLQMKHRPNCAFFVKEVSRHSEMIHLDKLL